MDSPHFFVDRSLGRIEVPRLLRERGWNLITLAEHYGERVGARVDDTDWLALAGDRGWPVLMKDKKIRHRSAERDALIAAGVRAFCISSGNLTSAVMAEYYDNRRELIWQLAKEAGSGIWVVSLSDVRRTDV